jgi:hypothetical protein
LEERDANGAVIELITASTDLTEHLEAFAEGHTDVIAFGAVVYGRVALLNQKIANPVSLLKEMLDRFNLLLSANTCNSHLQRHRKWRNFLPSHERSSTRCSREVFGPSPSQDYSSERFHSIQALQLVLEAIRATRARTASTASTVQRTAVPAASARAILCIWSHTDRRWTMRLMTAAGLVLICATTAAQTIPPSEAAKHEGEQGTVCGRIASEHTATSSRGTPTFINLDKPYPNQVFTVLIWGSDRAKVGAIPPSGMLCAMGEITSYRGTPEIVVKDAKSWVPPEVTT